MPRLRGRAKNIGRRTRNAQLVHDRRLNRSIEEHSTDNANLRDQVACSRANENSEQRVQRLHANALRQREGIRFNFLDKVFKKKKVAGEKCKEETAESSLRIISVYRYDPEGEEPPYMQDYEVDLKESGGLILDVLNYIKNEIDPTLAFRRSCREGICGSCGMNLNGRNGLACIKRCPPGKLTIYPLPHMWVVKDLVVDMTNFYSQYKFVEPWLQRCDEKDFKRGSRELKQSIRDRGKMDGMYECILCACCATSCPAYWWHGNADHPKRFLGPAALLQAYRWVIDSRDDNHCSRLKKLQGDFNIWKCHTIFNCAVACPKSLNPGKYIGLMKLMQTGKVQKEEPDMVQLTPDEVAKQAKKDETDEKKVEKKGK